MPINDSRFPWRQLAAVGVAGATLVLGTGSAAAQDLHSGGVSPSTESRDTGAAQVDAAQATRSGGLPITGSDVAELTILGAAGVAAGSGAVLISRRRNRTDRRSLSGR